MNNLTVSINRAEITPSDPEPDPFPDPTPQTQELIVSIQHSKRAFPPGEHVIPPVESGGHQIELNGEEGVVAEGSNVEEQPTPVIETEGTSVGQVGEVLRDESEREPAIPTPPCEMNSNQVDLVEQEKDEIAPTSLTEEVQPSSSVHLSPSKDVQLSSPSPVQPPPTLELQPSPSSEEGHPSSSAQPPR